MLPIGDLVTGRRNYRPKHVQLIGIINKPSLLHLAGCIIVSVMHGHTNIILNYSRCAVYCSLLIIRFFLKSCTTINNFLKNIFLLLDQLDRSSEK